MGRRSRQKEAILRCLKSTACHPDASWVYEQVKREIPNISLGTVYRNLRVMSENGEILEMDFAGDLTRYDGSVHDHYHFRCNLCGRVFDVDEQVNEDINERVSRRTGFQVDSHRLEFRGFCLDCRRKQ